MNRSENCPRGARPKTDPQKSQAATQKLLHLGIVVGSFLIAIGFGLWSASLTHYHAIVKAGHVEDSSEWTPVERAPLVKP